MKRKSKDIIEREVNTAQGGVDKEREVIKHGSSSGVNKGKYTEPPLKVNKGKYTGIKNKLEVVEGDTSKTESLHEVEEGDTSRTDRSGIR